MIKGRHVSLHTLEETHLEDVYHILMNDDIGNCFSTTYQEIRFGGLVEFLYTTEPGTNSKAFTIVHEDKNIGFVTLNNIHPIRRSAYIGIVGISPKDQNGMHGVDALRTLIRYSFDILNLRRLYSHTFGDNTKMKSLYKLGGWTLEGTEREYTYRNGEWLDKEIWAVLRSEYKEK
tara:strand:- start:778 stop:1302 length:525 start_codon:yes stop_codon:yes gene_type:complete